MSDSSRRGFLILAGAGAAAVGTVAVAPEVLAAGGGAAHPNVNGPLVAHVTDLRTGRLSVMMGEREVVIHDKALCAKLAKALG